MTKEYAYSIDISQIILHITGHVFTFAQAQGRFVSPDKFDNDCVTWQLMPEHSSGLDFFNWYCDERPYDQFFLTKEECMVAFLKYWFIYKKKWVSIGQD